MTLLHPNRSLHRGPYFQSRFQSSYELQHNMPHDLWSSVGPETRLGLLFPFSNLLRCCRSFIFPNSGCGFPILLSTSIRRTQFSLPWSCCTGKDRYSLPQPFVQASIQPSLPKKGTRFNKPKKSSLNKPKI